MGNARWDSDSWNQYSSTTRSLRQEEVFSRRQISEAFDPAKIQFRESCDSEQNPQSTPIIIGLDVTGSMGFIADALAKEKLGPLVEDVLRLQPVRDPHFMFMGIGDIGDQAPLQVTQFEADLKIGEQLRDIWLEKHGGANDSEAYNVPWHFAANYTKLDAFTKRNKKSYLFTVGDEQCPPDLSASDLSKVYGRHFTSGISNIDLLAAVREKYHVFHIIVEEGDYAKRHLTDVRRSWNNMLGETYVINMPNHKNISDLIVQAIIRTEANEPQVLHERVLDLT